MEEKDVFRQNEYAKYQRRLKLSVVMAEVYKKQLDILRKYSRVDDATQATCAHNTVNSICSENIHISEQEASLIENMFGLLQNSMQKQAELNSYIENKLTEEGKLLEGLAAIENITSDRKANAMVFVHAFSIAASLILLRALLVSDFITRIFL